MQPYQVFTELRARSAGAINRGTLYDVVEALAAAEWIAEEPNVPGNPTLYGY
ncbi:hypothetical protein [Amycolatopsis methanolica]|uniref:Uncharacterized protein n=1 Tax=Amycolatopsis methanolica 239 TaxID=1068978 RepID=A0A076N441_AMYME|nr:hypothetical protein [Amycolatopsis methanolica]AIJ26051.1 hypothetical protein AMETH_5959 [Amycolatopsis methanolica 239]